MGPLVAMGKSASAPAVIGARTAALRSATSWLLKFPLLKAQPSSHTSCATAQGMRFGLPTFQQESFMTIVRYEPWALLSRFQRQFDRALGESADGAAAANVSWIPHVDVREEAERFVLA